MSLLFASTYESGIGWKGVQAPADRISVVPAPGASDDPWRPVGNALRVELRPGDQTSFGHRAEVYDRSPSPWSTPSAAWPDPEGSERWAAFSLMLDPDFKPSSPWVVVTQIAKGYRGGSPALSVAIDRDVLRLDGNISRSLGKITPGRWTRLMIGRLNSSDGWVQVFRDGLEVVPRTPAATMDVDSKGVDPTYLKQGVYCSGSRPEPAVVFYGPTRLGTTPADVQ